MPTNPRSSIQIFNEGDFRLFRSNREELLALNFKEKKYVLCLFGLWSKQHPNPPSDRAYSELKDAIATNQMPTDICYLGVLDVQRYPKVVILSKRTNTPINSIPKLVLFNTNGIIIDIFPSGVPKTANSILDFVNRQVQRSITKKKVSQRYEDLESSEEEEAPQIKKKHRSDGSYFEPDFGKVPRIRGYIKGRTVAQEEGEDFLVPEEIIPHNQPWSQLQD
jgi:hypothetical protein